MWTWRGQGSRICGSMFICKPGLRAVELMIYDTATVYLPNRNQMDFLERILNPEMKVSRVGCVGIDDGYFGEVKRSNWIRSEYESPRSQKRSPDRLRLIVRQTIFSVLQSQIMDKRLKKYLACLDRPKFSTLADDKNQWRQFKPQLLGPVHIMRPTNHDRCQHAPQHL
jgi:hypothetical protein